MKTQILSQIVRNRGHRLFILTLTALMVLGVILTIAFTYAQDDMPKKTAKFMKGVSGEVSGISKDFIAIVYRRDEARGSEEEIGLPIATDVILEHKKSLSEIGVGDMVDVEFEEAEEETQEGPRSKRVAKVVRFIRAAPKQVVEESVLDANVENNLEIEE